MKNRFMTQPVTIDMGFALFLIVRVFSIFWAKDFFTFLSLIIFLWWLVSYWLNIIDYKRMEHNNEQ